MRRPGAKSTAEVLAAGGEAEATRCRGRHHGLELVADLVGQLVSGGAGDGELVSRQTVAQLCGSQDAVRVVQEVGS